MKSALMFVGAIGVVVIACAVAAVYLGYNFSASADQSSIVGSKVPPEVKLTPETVYGYVMDKNQNGIPGATVTIYNVKVVDSYPLSDGLVNIAGNPQTADSGSFAGFYSFEGLQSGYYNITAEKDGHMWFAIVNVTGSDANGVNHEVTLPDYRNPA